MCGLELKTGVLIEIRGYDAVGGENLLRFNCGANRSKARELVAAAQRT
jgi:hypothetical protein